MDWIKYIFYRVGLGSLVAEFCHTNVLDAALDALFGTPIK